MKRAILIILLSILPSICLAEGLNIPAAAKDQAELSQDEVIRIASDKAQELGFKTEEMSVLFDEDNAKIIEHSRRSGVSVYNKKTGKWDKALPSTPEKDFPVLEGRNYQAVYFAPKAQRMGGDLWVFVDKSTGEVIKWVLGK